MLMLCRKNEGKQQGGKGGRDVRTERQGGMKQMKEGEREGRRERGRGDEGSKTDAWGTCGLLQG